VGWSSGGPAMPIRPMATVPFGLLGVRLGSRDASIRITWGCAVQFLKPNAPPLPKGGDQQ